MYKHTFYYFLGNKKYPEIYILLSKVEKCPFLTKWFDPLDLCKQKKLLDLDYIYPRGVRGGVALFFF